MVCLTERKLHQDILDHTLTINNFQIAQDQQTFSGSHLFYLTWYLFLIYLYFLLHCDATLLCKKAGLNLPRGMNNVFLILWICNFQFKDQTSFFLPL